MLSKTTSPTLHPVWQQLNEHQQQITENSIAGLFATNPERFEQFSQRFEGILLDYSKNLISADTKKLLIELAENMQLAKWRESMFTGDELNHTEHRSVLHTALRSNNNDYPEVQDVLNQMSDFVTGVHQGEILGYSGQPITDVVNIGIGGSDLGPRMVVDALKPWQLATIRSHFVSNLDSRELDDVLQQLNPATTLFLIASKTFTTLETMINANSAREWFLQQSGAGEEAIKKHFVALSSNYEKTKEFGIAKENVFVFWDWVGGRYSLWSAIGLSIALAVGMDKFKELLSGAEAMDKHFQQAPLEENLPVLLALVGVWNREFLNTESHAVLPYDFSLKLFPAYLQQLDMESNGKQVDRNGKHVDYATAPVVWGEVCPNGQHSFFQLLHQSTTTVAIDFIGTINPNYALAAHHTPLIANMFAQAEGLMNGCDLDSATAALSDLPADEQMMLAPYKSFPGNRPSNLLLIDKLDPRTLGSLLALYEHKIFVQGVIWNINSFDQMGVELGKALAMQIQDQLERGVCDESEHDSSTNGLMSAYLNRKQGE